MVKESDNWIVGWLDSRRVLAVSKRVYTCVYLAQIGVLDLFGRYILLLRGQIEGIMLK